MVRATKPSGKGPAIALVGSETLLGAEIADVLQTRLPGVRISSFAATGEGNFGQDKGEAVYVDPLTAEAITGQDAIVIAGTPEGAIKAYDLARKSAPKAVLVDCTGHLEGKAEGRLIAPLVDTVNVSAGDLVILAHPAAAAIGITLLRLAKLGALRRSVVEIFAPASEHGKRGIAELHQQTTNLLSFKPLDKAVFDSQLAFNMLSGYGEDAPQQLSTIEQRIERHLTSILHVYAAQTEIAMPSLRLLQAPVFHGDSISCWIEFGETVTAQAIREALGSAQIDVREAQHEPPTNVGVAGQSGLTAGDIRLDRNYPRAAWLWLAADNVRLSADACADVLTQPRATIQ